jgi:primosomal protein N'
MLRERCRRDAAPLWCTSSVPSPSLLNDGAYRSWGDVSGGWPQVTVVDRRNSDPHDGVLAPVSLGAAHRALGGDEPVAVVVVLQRLGDGRLLACAKCGELARCAVCAQGEEEVDGRLACRERHEPRANFCRSCGATNLRRVRLGVTTLARDVAAQLAQSVSEVTASSDLDGALQRVVVGTEAVWQRVRRSGVVIFVDFDQYLLAPRASSRHSAITAVGKAGRLVGARREGRGSVVLQTRRRADPVIDALVRANFDAIIDEDVRIARMLALPPFGAEAEVSGDGASTFVEGLGHGVTVSTSASGFLVRAADVATLTSALRAAPRPLAKFRVAVR